MGNYEVSHLLSVWCVCLLIKVVLRVLHRAVQQQLHAKKETTRNLTNGKSRTGDCARRLPIDDTISLRYTHEWSDIKIEPYKPGLLHSIRPDVSLGLVCVRPSVHQIFYTSPLVPIRSRCLSGRAEFSRSDSMPIRMVIRFPTVKFQLPSLICIKRRYMPTLIGTGSVFLDLIQCSFARAGESLHTIYSPPNFTSPMQQGWVRASRTPHSRPRPDKFEAKAR
jgi:hypothetical protein